MIFAHGHLVNWPFTIIYGFAVPKTSEMKALGAILVITKGIGINIIIPF